MKRTESRELAFTILFEYSFDQTITILDHYDVAIAERGVPKDTFTRTLLEGVQNNLQAIDEAIVKYSAKWKKARIAPVTMAVLRLAAFEMMYLEDVPLRVSLNEAIEIAKKFDDDKAYEFVNGVLNALMHDARAVGDV
jgi:N utilization substance protein B